MKFKPRISIGLRYETELYKIAIKHGIFIPQSSKYYGEDRKMSTEIDMK